jgi:hypothetical protein
LNLQQNAVAAGAAPSAGAATTSKADAGVVDMDLESPYSPAASEGDDLFEPPAGANKETKARPKELKTTVTTSAGKKDIAIKMEKNKLKIVGSLPNAAIENQVKEKVGFLKIL